MFDFNQESCPVVAPSCMITSGMSNSWNGFRGSTRCQSTFIYPNGSSTRSWYRRSTPSEPCGCWSSKSASNVRSCSSARPGPASRRPYRTSCGSWTRTRTFCWISTSPVARRRSMFSGIWKRTWKSGRRIYTDLRPGNDFSSSWMISTCHRCVVVVNNQCRLFISSGRPTRNK